MNAETDPHEGATTADGQKSETVRAIVMASSGNLIEWFDFYVYAFFSVYFAEQFFLNTGQTGAFMQAAGVFFIGFLMRPVGGYVFGRMADRTGRRHAMVVSILMMGAGSLAMALLPTAHAVGALAPILLIIVRCIQGIAVGGEYGSVATYMSEVAERHRRGFYSSFQYVTLIGGQLLASLLAVIMTHVLGDERIADGWWRLPFVIGAFAALISLWLRRGIPETASPRDQMHEQSGSFTEVWRHQRSFWVVLGITSIGSLSFYVFTTYMQKYLINTAGFSRGNVAGMMTICLLLFLLMQPLAGHVSDRIGRRNSMLIYAAGMIILPLPLLQAIGQQTSALPAMLMILLAMIFLSFYTSVSGIVKAEVFPAHVRGMGVGFTYAIGNSLFGGSAEYVALFLKEHGLPDIFPLYMIAIALVGLIAILAMHDDRQESTIDFPDSSAYRQKG